MSAAERTAELVVAYTRAGLATRPRRVPRAQYPMLLESEYATQLVSFVNEWRAAIRPLLDDLPEILREARRDSATVRLDSPTRARSHTNKAREVVKSTIERVPLVAVRSARRATDHQAKQFARQTQAALGVAVPTHDAGLDRRIAAFVHENASRLQTHGETAINAIEDILARAFTTGQSADEVAAEIVARLDVAESKARFLAHDQMGRLYAQVTRMRNKEVGVLAFRWWTQADGRVRSSHATKHKRIFPYTGSRAPSFFPGDDPGCRCWEEAVYEEIKAKVRELLGKGRQRVA